MVRVKRGVTARRRHRKVLSSVKGHSGGKRRLFKTANESLLRSLAYQYRDRRNKKRDLRRLWITRINAGVRQHGLSYSRFMAELARSGTGLNRRMLAEMAARDPADFARLVQQITSPPAPQSDEAPSESPPPPPSAEARPDTPPAPDAPASPRKRATRSTTTRKPRGKASSP